MLLLELVRPTSVPFKRRFNYQKAKWEDFSNELESKIEQITSVADNYHYLCGTSEQDSQKSHPSGLQGAIYTWSIGGKFQAV